MKKEKSFGSQAQKSWENFGRKNNGNDQESKNSKIFYRMIKASKNEKEFKLQTIKTKNGKVLVEENEIVNRWKEYFNELLNC